MPQAGQADLLSLPIDLHVAPDLEGKRRNELAKEKLRFSELKKQEGSIGRLSWLLEPKASPQPGARTVRPPWQLPAAGDGDPPGCPCGRMSLGGEVQDGFINSAENVFSSSKIHFPRKHNYVAKTAPGSLRIRAPQNGTKQLVLSKKKSGEFKMA